MFKFELTERGYLRKHESSDLEYKENFHRGDEMLKYIKTLVGMANNKGGQIVFGVKDSPHIPLGMTNSKFADLDPKDFENQITQYFSPSIEWEMDTVTYDEKMFGVITVKEADNKPVVCTKSKAINNLLREGAVYYRYRGETREIGYPELRKLLDAEKEKERILWISHIQKIATIGVSNVEMLDMVKGELTVSDKKLLIDKELIAKIKFIKEGHFVESDEVGAPALRLVGDVEGVDLKEVTAINPNKIYIYQTSQLQEQLGLNQHEMQAIIYTLEIKGKVKWHLAIPNGKSVVHKYTSALLDVLKRKLTSPDFLDFCVKKYNEHRKEQRECRKKKC